jgi:glycosyltransferase involved in cell wall biosynthesis
MPFYPGQNIKNHKDNFDLNIKEKFKINGDYIFYPAQFWAHKNHTYILKGLKILKKNYKIDLKAVFVGSDAGNLNFVKDTVKKLNLSDKVYFLGFVESEDMVALYKNSVALVMPTYFGPTNIPPMEAFALGVPVLYSDLPGLIDQVGDSALLMDLSDPGSMAKHLADLINKDGLREKLIRLSKNKIITNNNHNEIIDLICSQFKTKMQSWKNL